MKRESFFKKINIRAIEFLLLDIIIILSVYTANVFLFNENVDLINDTNKLILFMFFTVLIKLGIFILLKLYHLVLEYVGILEVFKISFGVLLSNIIIVVLMVATNYLVMPWYVVMLLIPLEIGLFSGTRLLKRILISVGILPGSKHTNKNINTLIIGAGDGGKIVLTELKNNNRLQNKPIAFIDDDSEKIGNYLNGLPVLGPIADINDYIETLKVEEVIIAIANIDKKRLKEIINLVNESNVKIKRLPLLFESPNSRYQIMDVKIEDLLNRGVINLHNDGIYDLIESKKVLVTGGGGSIGSELAFQILKYNPKSLIIFDIYENTTYDTQIELMNILTANKLNTQIEVIIGSVYNKKRVEYLFDKFSPDIVFHAAAYKHVPLMEDSPNEAVRTNIVGTYTIAKACHDYNVKKMVLVSTDKAVRPTNVMGATKAFAEKIIQYFDSISETSYSAVRFGNVLGSHGSVVPLFKKQIQNGGPVTITHPDITRYFMTIPEAVSLILQSAVYSKGGEIFILDMGEPVKIYDLAINMIRLSGHVPHEDIKIEFIGLRPGEKLFEELLVDTENHIKTENDKIFIEKSNGIIDIDQALKDIIPKLDELNNSDMKEFVKTFVNSYNIDTES